MNVQRFRVYYGDAVTPDPDRPTWSEDLTIIMVDRMMAERHSTTELPPSQRGPSASTNHPHAWVLLWLWCAARRVGSTGATFTEWSGQVLDFDRLTADDTVATDDAPEDVELDPTNRVGVTI